MKTQLVQTQKHILSQQMQLSTKILQMSAVELAEYVQELTLENPMLEIGQIQENSALFQVGDSMQSQTGESMPPQTGDSMQSQMGDSMPPRTGDIMQSQTGDTLRFQTEDSMQYDFLDFASEKGESLYEHLLYQLVGMKLTKTQKQLLKHLIWNLNEDGYLGFSVEELSESLSVSTAEIEETVTVLQSMDPPGIGARNLQECLLLQAERQKEREAVKDVQDVEEIILHHLPLLAAKNYHRIAKEMGISVKRAQQAHLQICTFNPKPGNGFSNQQPVQVIAPDVYIDAGGQKLEVFLNNECQPELHICEYYRNLGRREQLDQELEQYISEKLKQAKWVMRCIDQRKNTLRRCAEAIAKIQASFFTTGCRSLKPLTLADLAFELEVSESTVSRTMKNKYLKCKYGIFPMSAFLSGEVGKNTGQTQSSILEHMKSIIDGEDASTPLSDQAIAVALSEKGIEISRRTVAKYRELLGIPSAFARKRDAFKDS